MPQLAPLYTAANCRIAYQLNWSLSVFGRAAFPPAPQWIDDLTTAVEPDDQSWSRRGEPDGDLLTAHRGR